MTPQEFCYWLQGFAELGGDAPTAEQWSAIKDHLQLTFVKVTPSYTWPNQILPNTYPLVTCSTSGKSVDQSFDPATTFIC